MTVEICWGAEESVRGGRRAAWGKICSINVHQSEAWPASREIPYTKSPDNTTSLSLLFAIDHYLLSILHEKKASLRCENEYSKSPHKNIRKLGLPCRIFAIVLPKTDGHATLMVVQRQIASSAYLPREEEEMGIPKRRRQTLLPSMRGYSFSTAVPGRNSSQPV